MSTRDDLPSLLARLTPDQQERFWLQNPHLKGTVATEIPPAPPNRPILPAIAPKTRVRQSNKGPNKLEAAWGEWLKQTHPEITGLKYNALTLSIANGVRYTSDWTGWLDGTLTAYEVKGPYSYAGALEKLKVAARAWPEIDFILAWKDQGCWRTQEILP